MSDFLNYIRNEEQKKMTEEEKLQRHKAKQRVIQEQTYDVNDLEDDLDDDDFYVEEELVEAHRIPSIVSKPQRKFVAPQHETEIEYEEPVVQQQVQPRKHVRRTVEPTQFSEPSQENMPSMNPVLKEAYNLIDEMKNKMETMFFKYGMTGLEKLNECMLDMCDEIMNPPVKKISQHYEPEEEIEIVEKTIPKKKTINTKPVKKPVQKATTKTAVKPVKSKSEEELLKEKKESMEKMFDTADLSKLSDVLVKQSEVQETNAEDRKAKIEARGKALEERLTKKTKKQVETEPEEDYTTEDLEIVPDEDSIIEIDNLETTELDIPAEENEEN